VGLLGRFYTVGILLIAPWLLSHQLSTGCSEKSDAALVDTATDPCEQPFVCDDGRAMSTATDRALSEAIPLPGRGASIAVGDLIGDGTDQIYIGTTAGLTRLNGEGWRGATELWVSHSDEVRPLIADVTGDGADDLLLGIPYSDDEAGQVLVFPGPISDPLDWSSPHHELQGGDGSEAGLAMSLMDLNGDGALDLLVGEQLRFGPITETRALGGLDDAVWQSSEAATIGGVAAGDVDGDGRADLVFLVGLTELADEGDLPTPAESCGDPAELRVALGPRYAGVHSIDDVTLRVPFPADASALGLAWRDGAALKVMDLDGDGVAEVITTALSLTDSLFGEPEVLIFSGPLAAGDAPAARFVPPPSYLAAVGDLDGDGAADLLQAGADFWGAELTPTVLRGPLLEASPFDAERCTYTVEESWLSEPLDAAWIGDLDRDGAADVIAASGASAFVELGAR